MSDTGIDFALSVEGDSPSPALSDALHLEEFGSGLVAADFDDDGSTDLFFPQTNGESRLYWGNGGGTFEAASAEAGR